MSQYDSHTLEWNERDRKKIQTDYDDMLQPAGKVFRITMEQFKIVRAAAIRICKDQGLTRISDRRQIGEGLIDDLEADRITFERLENGKDKIESVS